MAIEIPFLVFYLAVPSLLLSVLSQILSWRRKKSTEAKFPGPKQYPIIGRVHDLNRHAMWLKFKEWADIYGPIYQTSMAGQPFVIISNEEIAEDVLLKRGNIYSGRPQIRALFNHKQSNGYMALMDRTGESHQLIPSRSLCKILISTQTTGPSNENGSTPPCPTPTTKSSTGTSRPKPSAT